ncbi:GPW/gp25 family protein [Candidatus Chloroploca sp. M-50]|uniref:GPW/gp25 family protein n=1 Tax=Candidatus Chloroploca mongolica TaxID=2528176 RepID=A0ABS4DF86_9CHLR|nr:GPW/gp25 family protein [Candidatus Chloroploca mongolica]MBP1468100.1 GPW/gp25 family protein [Candidatus Chloroploca mongolica]
MEYLTSSISFPFPFAITDGRISASGGDEALRGKIIQVLFTAPGERVNLPEFGCGLLNQIFEPNDGVIAAAMEFTIAQALAHWLGDEISVDGVGVTAEGELITVEIVYTRRRDLARQAVRLHFR